jgi:hypothetical protein
VPVMIFLTCVGRRKRYQSCLILKPHISLCLKSWFSCSLQNTSLQNFGTYLESVWPPNCSRLSQSLNINWNAILNMEFTPSVVERRLVKGTLLNPFHVQGTEHLNTLLQVSERMGWLLLLFRGPRTQGWRDDGVAVDAGCHCS